MPQLSFTARLKKVLSKQAQDAAPWLAATAIADIGVSLYQSVSTNKTSHTVDNKLVNPLRNATDTTPRDTLANQAQQVKDQLFVTSEVLGYTQAIALTLLTLPGLFKSFSHHAAKGALTWGQYLSQDWDYLAGRGLQVAGATVDAYGLVQHGAENTATATALFCVAPVLFFAGNVGVELNRDKRLEAAANVNQGNPPIANAPGEGGEFSSDYQRIGNP